MTDTTGRTLTTSGSAALSSEKLDRKPVVSRRRLLVGLGLWLLSYVPFPLPLLWLLRQVGLLTTNESGRQFVLVLWGVQIILGLLGLWIAGREAIGIVRRRGWRRLPRTMWRLLTDNEPFR